MTVPILARLEESRRVLTQAVPSVAEAVARRASKLSSANPLQTMSRSVTMPISWSSYPIGAYIMLAHQFREVADNRWGHPGDKTLIMELLEDDPEALRGTRRR